MKAITEYTIEETAKMSATSKELFDKVNGTTRSDWFEDFRQQSGYAHYKFSGTISDKLIEALGRYPTENEIIMLVDSGFSHFGATCSIDGRNFRGKVYID